MEGNIINYFEIILFICPLEKIGLGEQTGETKVVARPITIPSSTQGLVPFHTNSVSIFRLSMNLYGLCAHVRNQIYG